MRGVSLRHSDVSGAKHPGRLDADGARSPRAQPGEQSRRAAEGAGNCSEEGAQRAGPFASSWQSSPRPRLSLCWGGAAAGLRWRNCGSGQPGWQLELSWAAAHGRRPSCRNTRFGWHALARAPRLRTPQRLPSLLPASRQPTRLLLPACSTSKLPALPAELSEDQKEQLAATIVDVGLLCAHRCCCRSMPTAANRCTCCPCAHASRRLHMCAALACCVPCWPASACGPAIHRTPSLPARHPARRPTHLRRPPSSIPHPPAAEGLRVYSAKGGGPGGRRERHPGG